MRCSFGPLAGVGRAALVGAPFLLRPAAASQVLAFRRRPGCATPLLIPSYRFPGGGRPLFLGRYCPGADRVKLPIFLVEWI